MGINLGLERPQLGLLAHLNLVLQLSQLQHGGKQPGQALRRAAVGLQDQVGALGDTEQNGSNLLLPTGEGSGNERPASAAGRAAEVGDVPFHHQFTAFHSLLGREGDCAQFHTAGRHHLLQVGECHTDIGQHLPHGVHGLPHSAPVFQSFPKKWEALVGDEQCQVLLFRQLNGHTAVEAVQQTHKQHKPQGVHHHFWGEYHLFQLQRGGKGPANRQNDETLQQL